MNYCSTLSRDAEISSGTAVLDEAALHDLSVDRADTAMRCTTRPREVGTCDTVQCDDMPEHMSYSHQRRTAVVRCALCARSAPEELDARRLVLSDRLSVLEICAGAGGQSRGLELAGFDHEMAVEIDADACETLRLNRPEWNVIEGDVREVSGHNYRGIDLIAGGVPCPPFSIAGKQLGHADERDLFPEALRIIREARPMAVMLENVKGLSSAKFAPYRSTILDQLTQLGYHADWQVINASEHGVPQLRPRFILMAVLAKFSDRLRWPEPVGTPPTVGEKLFPLMSAHGWKGADRWAKQANGIAPTLVGGSRKHGGPDLGPTRAREAWLRLGVDGRGLADAAPDANTPFDATPKLTVEMAARVQGFDADWHIYGRKTSAYRQVGNAFPPPVARAVGDSIRYALGVPVIKSSTEAFLRAV